MTEQPIRITAAERVRHGNTGALDIAIAQLRTIYLEHTGKLNGQTVEITVRLETHDRRPTRRA